MPERMKCCGGVGAHKLDCRLSHTDSSMPAGEITGAHVPTIHVLSPDSEHPWYRWSCSCGAVCGDHKWNNERTALKMYAQNHWNKAMADEVAALRAEVNELVAGEDNWRMRAEQLRAERDAAIADRALGWKIENELAAEVERMRPVVEYAGRFIDTSGLPHRYRDLHAAVDAYRAASSEQEATDAD